MARRILAAWILLWLGACSSGPDVPDELARSTGIFVRMTSPMSLRQSMFYAVFPQGTPRQYVSFLFSSLGTAEWPPVEGMEGMAEDLPIAQLPANVFITHGSPDPQRGMQVVIRWDDERRMILFDGYVDPSQPPVIRRETDLPIVEPSELARLAAQSNLEMGASAQGF